MADDDDADDDDNDDNGECGGVAILVIGWTESWDIGGGTVTTATRIGSNDFFLR